MPDKIIDRVLQFLENENIPPTRYEKEIGLSNGYLNTQKKRHADIGESVIRKIAESNVNLSLEWLITGSGKMFKPAVVENAVGEPVVKYVRLTDKKIDLQVVPLYNFEAAAGLVKLLDNQQNVVDYISIPNIPKCDGAVTISGDSMYPLLKSGDIVVYKHVHDIINGIFWGEMYLISLEMNDEDRTMVKYIQKSELGPQYIKLVSQNQHHAPKDVLLANVTALASIKASIRINSMQ